MKTTLVGLAAAVLVVCGCSGGSSGAGGGSATGGGSASGGGTGGATGGGTGGATGGGTGGATGGGTGGATGGGTGGATGGGTGGATGGGTGGATGGGTGGATGGGTGGATGGGTGGATGGGTGGAAGGGAGGGAGRTMIITNFLDYVWETGDAGNVAARNALQMRVVVETDAGPTYFNSVQLDAGVYAITGLPPGRALLEYSRGRFLDSEGDRIDFGGLVTGRATTVLADAGTRLNADVSNLAPWDLQADQLNFTSVNTGGYYNTFTQYATTLADGGPAAPTAGATALTINTGYGLELIDATQGDILRFSQLRYAQLAAPNTDAGVAVVGSPVTYGVAAPFTMASGATNYAQAVMLPVTQNSTLALDLRRGESAAMRPLVHPSATLTFNGFFVGAIPLGAAKGQAIDYDGYPILMQIYGPAADTTTLSLNVAYGNPFPASWPLMGGSFAQFTTTHALAGGQQVPMRHNVVGFEDTAALNAGPHRPRISPPLGLQVNGVTGDQTLTGSGLTITWGAPTIGTPNSYRVNVNRLFLSGATPTSELAAFLITDRTSARIPVGTLAAGQRYVVQVYAITNPGNDPKAAPFRSNAFPYAYAATAGGTLILP